VIPAFIQRTSKTECYSTPRWAVRALLEREKFRGMMLDPCCGEGAILSTLFEAGYECMGSEIRQASEVPRRVASVPVFYGSDFLDPGEYEPCSVDNIITNPPFSIAMEFAERCLIVAAGKIALFLRIQFLESEKRVLLFSRQMLSRVYIFTKRVALWPEGTPAEKRSGASTVTYAWFVFDKGYQGEPVLSWIDGAAETRHRNKGDGDGYDPPSRSRGLPPLFGHSEHAGGRAPSAPPSIGVQEPSYEESLSPKDAG
jgi:predicted RNA methylase